MNDLQELYHRYLENIQIICQRQIHLGDKFDGGYHVCEDPDVIPVKPCLVYSFGIRKDFSFDDAVARTFGCEVHSFDPGDGQQDHQHSDSVTFHSQGIADRDGTNEKNWTLKTLQTIKKQLGHEQTRLNLLKLDVEGSEWSALAEMIRTGSIDDISQLIVEFHIWVTYGGVTNLKSREDYVFHLNILRDLYEMGFRIFFLRRWHHYCIFFDDNRVPRTGCHETHFLRIHR